MRSLSGFAAFAALALAAASPLFAQQGPEFGVDAPSIYVVSSWAMEPTAANSTWELDQSNGHRYLTSGGPLFGQVQLPQGAVIRFVELEACDNSATNQVTGSLYRMNETSLVSLGIIATGIATIPGCGRFAFDVPAGEVVDNYQYRYVVGSWNLTLDSTTTIGGIRVAYQLQVSPAPAVATFGDVPTGDPAFQFIEALVASGVTAGCGGGNYCPDAPLTRRQMAVFLSKALGLYWPELGAP